MFLQLQEMAGACPHCQAPLGNVPVTAVATAYTAPALGMLRGCGHLVVLAGRSWLVRCESDRQARLMPAAGVHPAVVPVPAVGVRKR